MRSSGLKHKLGWLELGLYLGGVALLAVFFQIRADSDRQREDGLRAFHDAGLKTVMAPDLELWDARRVAEYEESLKVEAGPPLAVMTIDKLNIQVPVYDGADDFNLNRGVARIKGTATIDAVGNLGIAGHRDGFFRGLKDIAMGDRIEASRSGREGFSERRRRLRRFHECAQEGGEELRHRSPAPRRLQGDGTRPGRH